ncbi:rod shape-determining protein MreD [Calidifontibacter terrae]
MIPQRLTVVRAILVVFAALLTVTVLPRFGMPIDIAAVLVVAVALRGGTEAGALMGLATGLLVDLTPPGSTPLGIGALSYATVGAVAGGLHRSLRVSILLPALVVLVAETLLQASRAAALVASGMPVEPLRALSFVLLTALAGALLVPPLLRMERWFVHRGMA